MNYTINTTRAFDKCVKLCKKRGLNISLMLDAIKILQEHGCLPDKYKPHKLSGERKGQWECHIKADWLLVWEQNDTELTLLLLQTGSHSDIMK